MREYKIWKDFLLTVFKLKHLSCLVGWFCFGFGFVSVFWVRSPRQLKYLKRNSFDFKWAYQRQQNFQFPKLHLITTQREKLPQVSLLNRLALIKHKSFESDFYSAHWVITEKEQFPWFPLFALISRSKKTKPTFQFLVFLSLLSCGFWCGACWLQLPHSYQESQLRYDRIRVHWNKSSCTHSMPFIPSSRTLPLLCNAVSKTRWPITCFWTEDQSHRKHTVKRKQVSKCPVIHFS